MARVCDPMRRASRFTLPIVIALTPLVLSAGAGASTITVGSPLAGVFSQGGPSTKDGMVANITIGAPGAHATSPVDGAIVRWHLIDATAGPFELRVLRPAGGPSYTAVGSSAPVVTTTNELETFPTLIPIKAGETVALGIAKGATAGYTPSPGSSFELWVPPLAEGETGPWIEEGRSGAEIGYNAEVQPRPAVTGINPPSGPLTGGTSVTIAGTDFTGVSSVNFGGRAATGYSVGGEGQITALAPPGAYGKSDVTVTTIAGTSPVTAADQFAYTACVVPNLKGRKLKSARKALKAADCRPGKVMRKRGVTNKTGKVVSQSPKAKKQLAPGSKVNIKLG